MNATEDWRPKIYIAFETILGPCDECDADDMGPSNRYDHGCASDHEIGRSRSLAAARMMAGKRAKLTGHPVYVEELGEGTRWSL